METGGIALITGASRGLGRAVALELAERGFEVIATMRDTQAGVALAEEARKRGRVLRVDRLDVTDADTIRIPNGLRVLVNNAGIESEYLPVEEAPSDLWRRVFETNLFGLVEVTRRAIPALRASGGGVICNVTSSSLLFPMPFFAAYRASKAAVAALGESLRAELAAFGIRIVEILPGPIATDMLAASDRLPEAAAYEPYRQLAERSPQGRKDVTSMITSAEDAARSVADAILDDGGPLRYACDPLGRAMLEGWGSAEDEERMRTLLASFGIKLPG